jgi:hypothetical protein
VPPWPPRRSISPTQSVWSWHRGSLCFAETAVTSLWSAATEAWTSSLAAARTVYSTRPEASESLKRANTSRALGCIETAWTWLPTQSPETAAGRAAALADLQGSQH